MVATDKPRTYLSRWEREALDTGFDYFIGIDEAGRGPIFGPVTAAAFCWRRPDAIAQYDWASRIADSKAIQEKNREEVFSEMAQDHEEWGDDSDYFYAPCSASAEVIDESDILSVTLDCMYKAYELVRGSLDQAGLIKEDTRIKVFIDGNKVPKQMVDLKNVETQSIVKGDAYIFSVSCASIVAKCTRDDVMRKLAKDYPEFGLEIHKGYLTAMHKAAVENFGPTAVHRLTFEPCKRMLLEKKKPVPKGRTIDCVIHKELNASLKKKTTTTQSTLTWDSSKPIAQCKKLLPPQETVWKILPGPYAELVVQPRSTTATAECEDGEN